MADGNTRLRDVLGTDVSVAFEPASGPGSGAFGLQNGRDRRRSPTELTLDRASISPTRL